MADEERAWVQQETEDGTVVALLPDAAVQAHRCDSHCHGDLHAVYSYADAANTVETITAFTRDHAINIRLPQGDVLALFERLERAPDGLPFADWLAARGMTTPEGADHDAMVCFRGYYRVIPQRDVYRMLRGRDPWRDWFRDHTRRR